MPSRDPTTSMDSTNGNPLAAASSLRTKSRRLPHPRAVSETHDSARVARPGSLSLDTNVRSVSGSDASSPHTLKHSSRRIGVPDLPPTPPIHSRHSSGNKQPGANLSANTSTPETPTHNSPPTPDVTPPRNMPPLAFRPPVNDRYPSATSRTDSFKTAREDPCSSDEEDTLPTLRPNLCLAQLSNNGVPLAAERSRRRKEVGLGLGLESDSTVTPRPSGDIQPEFVVFDGEWESPEMSEVEREWDDNLMRNVTVRKRPAQRLHLAPAIPTFEVLEGDIMSPTNATKVVKDLPLQERIVKHRLERDLENYRGQAHIPNSRSPTTFDIQRASAMSARSVTSSSTVIEAMVVDAPPTRRKLLRRSRKQGELRDFSFGQSMTESPPKSAVSIESSDQAPQKFIRISEKRHKSMLSNGTTNTASSNGRSRKEVLGSGAIPVVVIPSRGSSSKSSKPPSLRSTSSRKTKRSNSLGSAPISQSSKFNDPGYFGAAARKRTQSESAGSGHSVHAIDFTPTIPARRSSLSAPTSRNTSRAGSLTTESLKAHNLMQEKLQVAPKPEPVHKTDSHTGSAQNSRLYVDHNGDPFFGKRLSAQATPFSQASYETAGTAAEVSEAMAVSLHQHRNKSLVVVNQLSSSRPVPQQQPAIRPRIETSQPKASLNGSAAPITAPQATNPMDEVDSPLRNPRAPPEPPAIKFIPPTPAALTPGQEEDRQLGYEAEPAISESMPKRGLSLVRRALSNSRRSSESSVQTVSLLQRTFSLTGRRRGMDESTQTSKAVASHSTLYPSVEDRPADSTKLHPFWRPAHFWDDLEDHNGSGDDEFGRSPIIDNRSQPPKRGLSGKLKRTFAIVPIQDDESDDHRYFTTERRVVKRTSSGRIGVVKRRSSPTLRRVQAGAPRSLPGEERFGYGFKEGNGGRMLTIPGIGVRVEYIGFSGMKRRLSERRREERSEKLRASISTPRNVHSGVDDVLRRRE
ncbi:hypothetical protein BJ878DRAFT_421399 [Calycina marina]|uniref:Uncharacterized protein n=1 Tax=Calycina marina TaxID=1763456 RepID=A0A9P8CGG6_9HELO|nr:hypothetical protein BJ878DRAFT_421399 [Calycina marina]